ncbi:tetratricopeptide repeat-containing sensor histidine kinase [Flavobacterium soli]|uniref:tetratricopeptide repeat-containing sensor histidine kinase n=1 Tax=Flavobacterium soli TaxID=344881 RepID=UPI000417324B|nr:tetratricopeptide repeat-containing sensor histidine kinase [Flavobacterium soli]
MNEKIFFFFFFLSLIGCKKDNRVNTTTNNNRDDSLAYFFEKANSDSIAYESRQKYTQKAIALISKDKNDSMNRVNYFKVANRYFNMKAMEDYKKITSLLIENSIKSKDTAALIKAYGYMSDYYVSKKIYDSTYVYIYELEKLYGHLKDNVNASRNLLSKAILQHNQSDYLGCERTVFTMLKKLRLNNNYEMRYEAYNLLGITYGELAEYKLSKYYYGLALDIAERKEIPREYQYKATVLNNLGTLYRKQNKDDEALKVFKKALVQDSLFVDRPYIFAMIKDNMAYSEFKLGNHKHLPELFLEALKIRDSLNVVPGIIINNIHLSEYYAFRKDTLKAIDYAKRAYNVASDNNEVREMLPVLKQLSNVEPQKALQYSAEYYKIDDSLKLAERRIKNKFSRIEYETEELVLEKNKLVEQRKTLIYIALGIVLLGVFAYIIRSQAAKNKELQFLQEQQQANEEIYQLMLNQQNKIEEVRQLEKKKIAQDLHDGILGKLFGTRLNLGTLNNQVDNESIESRKNYIEELKIIEQEIREISHDLNSEKTAIFNNFVLMVSNFIETQRTVCKAKIDFTMDPAIDWNAIDNMAKINLYRILQEAFQNINKHAEAKNVFVTFAQINSIIELKVEDNGIGFNYLKKKKGIGLSNMRTRINSSAGTMSVVSELEKGAVLRFELPIEKPQI